MFTLKSILNAMAVFGFALGAIAHPRPVRSAAADNPCNLVLTEDPVEPSDYKSRLADIQTRSEGIELDAQGIKTQLKESGKVHSFTARILDRKAFLDSERVTVSQDKTSAAINNQVEALQSHYEFLFEYIVHIQDIKVADSLSTNIDVANDELLKALDSLENKLQSTACSVVLALRAKGSDMPEYEPTLLENYTSSSYPAVYNAYILANDGVKLSAYLKQMYGEISNAN
ncbi:uncharacterized protein LOC128211239 isoform X2 [Mya arenaria]|uniref:uncharacterized protein LOC128211239 isoform X2 n=1 Tax=Mya arenaria TaxID=6604 RepID=UPI0022E32DA5|nr:uncharacterized protein LOC128211239 isoform X2 [Mya arenaria]